MSVTKLLYIDTTQTQRYIFGSNRLMENIGASYLVTMATSQWVMATIEAKCQRHNITTNSDKQFNLDENKQFKDDQLEIELLTTGGGNSLLFGTSEALTNFLTHYSKKILVEAPELPLYYASMAFDWKQDNLREAIGKLTGEIADKAKRMRPVSEQLLGLGVTVPCRATGLPAVEMSKAKDQEDPYPISAEILAKHRVAQDDNENNVASPANSYLKTEIPICESKYRYPSDFDDMVARKGDANYIAIVHADGDKVGERIKHLGDGEDWDNREYLEQRRTFIRDLSQATQLALQATVKSLTNKIETDSDPNQWKPRIIGFFGDEEIRVELKEAGKGVFYLPFRPIISGGDDVTFICDGKLGISLALNYAKAFREATKSRFKDPISASAGVSIVRTHYPFARAYQLADALMKNAKTTRSSEGWNEDNYGAIDWHFTVGGLYGSLDQMREREYTVNNEDLKLTLRPVSIEKTGDNEIRTWETVEKGIRAFQEIKVDREKRQWANRRNKIKALRDATRQGPPGIEHFKKMFLADGPLPNVGHDDFSNSGFRDSRSGYFDALELSDWFIEVEPVSLEGMELCSK